jgi:hypothetical protein
LREFHPGRCLKPIEEGQGFRTRALDAWSCREFFPMSAFEPSRRAVLAAIGALAASQAGVIRSAFARPGPLGGVRVDVSPLLEPTAGWVAQTLPRATAEALAAAGRSGQGVSLRIDYVILGPNQGGECGPTKDQMIGVVMAGGAQWPLRASTPYFPSSVDNVMIEKSNYDRVYQLSQAFASWVARAM